MWIYLVIYHDEKTNQSKQLYHSHDHMTQFFRDYLIFTIPILTVEAIELDTNIRKIYHKYSVILTHDGSNLPFVAWLDINRHICIPPWETNNPIYEKTLPKVIKQRELNGEAYKCKQKYNDNILATYLKETGRENLTRSLIKS